MHISRDTSITNITNQAPIKLKFIYPWRPEQQRVLNKLQQYLDDKRIHIVAAPGAGKTVIGLEIFNRLRLKTLAISPTNVVKNQWLERLGAFLEDSSEVPHWCGTALTNPKLFTATTYQGLFSFDKKLSGVKQDDIDAQYTSLKHWFLEHDIHLLILDEAHHLKAAWWTVLMKLVNAYDDLIVVSLTATPPYDASALEWSRYQKLCGPVDEEISIPELVRSNSLCPHQDYIWMVKTDEKNITALNRQKSSLAAFIESLNQQAELLYLLQYHHWLDAERDLNQHDVLVNLDECFALLGLLKYHRLALPQHLLKLINLVESDIQVISVFGWQILLQSFLDGSHYPSAKPVQLFKKVLSTLLRNKHFLKYNRVSLDNSKRKLKAFNKTQERIKACYDIAKLELKYRQGWLRLVILADYIRDEKYQLSLDGMEASAGAYPIFHYFIHHMDETEAKKTALLTGRLSIIHQDLLPPLRNYLSVKVKLSLKEFSEDSHYVVLKVSSDYLSRAFTKMHKDGDIQILIGTRALLGEGWDAPHVNSLILATQTGAYVTTNQIRGRAIRIDPEDDLKTASIWHIVAVAADSENNAFIFRDLHKRFKTFAGIHANELRIESGIERISLSHNNTEESNHVMAQRLQDDIYNLQARWQNALEKVEKHVFQTGLQIDVKQSKRRDNLSRYVASIKKVQLAASREREQRKQTPVVVSKKKQILIAIALVLSPGAVLSLSIYLLGVGLGVSFSMTLLFVAVFLLIKRNEKQREQDASILLDPSNYPRKFAQLSHASMQALKLLPNKRNKAVCQLIARTLQPIAKIKPRDYPTKFSKLTLASLQQIEQIQRQGSVHDAICIDHMQTDYFRFSLNGFTRKENDVFLTALSQLLEPIQQPRYIIALNFAPSSKEIFPVPHILGSKRKYAEIFLSNWKYFLPEYQYARLLSTSSAQGRKYLLTTKASNYSEQADDNSIRLIERWE